MKSNKEIRAEIEEAMIILGEFWETDAESQQKALETAGKGLGALLNLLEKEGE